MKGNSTCVLLKKICDMDIVDPFDIAKMWIQTFG